MANRKASALYSDPVLAGFYDFDPRPRPDFDYCKSLAAHAGSVLDLGCGTGVLACRLSKTNDVVAVEPAEGMLNIAKSRDTGNQVQWLQESALTLRLGRRFDLILLTGHTFQVFCDDAAQRAVLETIAQHLTPGGRFIFDSRNPAHPARKTRTRAETLKRIDHPEYGPVNRWNESHYNESTGILTYTNGWEIIATGERHQVTRPIRYTKQSDICQRLREAGLQADRWLGGWDGTDFTPQAAEIIPIGRLNAPP